MKENSIFKYIYNKMLWFAGMAALHSVVVVSEAFAQQQVQLPGGINVGSGSSNASGSINSVTDFLIDQMLAIGAGISTLFALACVFAVKFGWMERRKIMDSIVLVLAMIALPTIIPAIYTFAQAAGN